MQKRVSITTGEVTDELSLVMTTRQLRELRDWTLQEDDIERFAYVYCKKQDGRLLAQEIDPVPPEQCSVMESHAVRPELSVERDRLGSAMEDGLVPIMVHSHPFSQTPSFSALDDDIMESYRDWLGQLYPSIPLAFVVMGHGGMDTAIYTDPRSPKREQLGIEIIGDWGLDTPMSAPFREHRLSVDEERYDRSIRALTDDGQQQVASSTVGIVGLGGLGSMVAVQLARFGVQDFVFADPDVVERSNLPRIYGAAESDVGRSKVDVVGEHIVEANPDAEIRAYPARVQDVPEDLLSQCDVIIGAVDRLSARLYCNELAVRHLRYYIDGGVAIKTDDDEQVTDERGLIQLVAPGANACLDCLGRNDPDRLHIEEMSDEEIEADVDRGYLDENVQAPEPAITPLNGMAASAITRLFTKLVTRYTTPADYLRFDGLDDDLVAVGTHPAEGCLTCGADGELGAGERSIDAEELVSGDGELEMAMDDVQNAEPDESVVECRTISQEDIAVNRPIDNSDSAEGESNVSVDQTETPVSSEVGTGQESGEATNPREPVWGSSGQHTADRSRSAPVADRESAASRSGNALGALVPVWKAVSKRKGQLGLLLLGYVVLKKLWEQR
ncbi:ThiF family adenylyltransferase [Natronoglomus mannanivorans]|uniref:ThiF family adenylyltransferase n=1 Tax=Natronoglomus mannanivorans TaxID=2979990 RepID=A0AAP2Z327_9EURY|nr:ThiF family adenylyltransferase [Halobacteria archaeon AArc-xg1-1]